MALVESNPTSRNRIIRSSVHNFTEAVEKSEHRSTPITDYSSMTSEESFHPLPAVDYEIEITAHLVVNSLILLGFNTDEYIAIYSGIAFDITPVTVKTFDKPNEKMLLIILHYLLCILDREEFLLAIEKCWPFLDPKEKNHFRKAVHISLIRLIEQGVVPNALYQGNLLTQAAGPEVWNLLHHLTNKALDHAIREFREAQFPEAISADPLDHAHQTDGVDVTSASSGLSSEGTSSGLTRESLFKEIDDKVESVRRVILHCHEERQGWNQYLQELEHRLIEAKKSIKQAEQKLRELHLQDEYNVLAEQGKAKRMKIMSRITSQKELLQSFLHSPLLQDVQKHLEEEKEIQGKEKIDVPHQSNSNTPASKSSLRRKMLSKEELEAYKISMRDAISTLIQKIEEVCSLV